MKRVPLSTEGIQKRLYLFCKRWYIKGWGLDLAAQPHRVFVVHILPFKGIFQQFIILSFISFPQSFNHFRLRISAFQETEPFPLSYHQTRPPSSCTVSFKLPQHKLHTGCLWAILPSRLGPSLWVGSREVNGIELWMNLTKHTLKYTHLRLEVSGLLFSALLNCS